DFTNELCGRLVQMLREQAHQGLGEIAAGEIVDATIAFGLPYDGGDLGGANLSARDQAIELGQVARMGHRQPEDLRPFHVLLPSWLACWISSNTRLGLRGISNSSILRCLSCSAFSIACANSGPTGIAPASPAPLMPRGFNGDGVTV